MKKGFTLIELLIAISIIALLSVIAISTFTNVQKQSRDAKRKADLNVIRSALEQFRADEGHYPDLLGANIIGSGTPPRIYLNPVPADLQLSSPYCYQKDPLDCSGNDCISYKLYAKLENIDAGTLQCGSYNQYNYQLTPP